MVKNENALNALMSRSWKSISTCGGPHIHVYKTADKITLGVPDFLVWLKGRSFAFETKFVKELPEKNARVLSHKFEGTQITFLRNIKRSGSIAYGLVGVGSLSEVFLIPVEDIPDKGNWKKKDFLKLAEKWDSVTMQNLNDIIDLALEGGENEKEVNIK